MNASDPWTHTHDHDDIPDSAPALEVVDVGKAELVRHAVPTIGPDEVLVKVAYSGVSVGTEMWAALRRLPPLMDGWGAPPYVPGYQCAGHVVAIGDEVSNPGFSVGDAVAVVNTNNTHQRYVAARSDHVHRLESDDRLVNGAFVMLSAASAHFLNRAGVHSGDSVLVIGQGLVGQFTAQLARMRGAYVVGTDVVPEQIEVSSKYCVDRVINAAIGPPSEQIVDQFPDGVDVVFHTADIPINDSFKCVRPDGTFIWVGSNPLGGLTIDVEQPHLKEIRWIFAIGVGSPENIKQTAHMLSTGLLDTSPLITHHINWRESSKVYNRLFTPDRDHFGGIVFDWRDAE